MKAMLTARKDEKLPAQERQLAHPAAFARLDDRVPAIQRLDVPPHGLGRRGRGVHFCVEGGDRPGVGLQRGADLVLEVIDDDEVREKRDQVFNAEQFAALEEIDGGLDGADALLGDDLAGDGEPELLAQRLVGAGRGSVGDGGGEVDLVVFEGERDGGRVFTHGRVDVHGGLNAGVLDAQAEGKVDVIGGGGGEGLGGEIGQEGGFGRGGVGGVDGDEGIVDGGVGGAELIDAEVEVPGRLVLSQGDGVTLVVVEEGGDQVARVQVGVTHQYVDEFRGSVRHEHAAVFVENGRVSLLLEHVQRFLPSFSLDPVRENVVGVVDGGRIQQQFVFAAMAADDFVRGVAVQIGLVPDHKVLKLLSHHSQLVSGVGCVSFLRQLGFRCDRIVEAVQL